MKKFLFLLLVIPSALWAQDEALSPKMELFKEYCLRVRDGIENNNISELKECVAGYEKANYKKNKSFIYGDSKINLLSMDYFAIKDSVEADSMGAHLRFTPDYVNAYIIANLMPVKIKEPSRLRGFYDCKYTHEAIKAGGKCKYEISKHGDENVELFVVAENGGLINLRVLGKKDKLIVENIEGKPFAQAKWKMPCDEEFSIEVENVSDKDISVIIVSN